MEQKEGQSEEAGRFEAACQRLATEAVRRGSADNVTVILVSIEFWKHSTHTHTSIQNIFCWTHRYTWMHEFRSSIWCWNENVVYYRELFLFLFFQSRAFENTVSNFSICAVWQQMLNNKLLYSLTIVFVLSKFLCMCQYVCQWIVSS